MALVHPFLNVELFTLIDVWFFSNEVDLFIMEFWNKLYKRRKSFLRLRECHVRQKINYQTWLNTYDDIDFFRLFRMQKSTFYKLLATLIEVDVIRLIHKKYRGGNCVVQPEKGLLVFLWYISKQDTLLSIADRFNLVPSTVMSIVNAFLYTILKLKSKYIFWPKTNEEYQHICDEFSNYPNVIGAVDGTHINVKVPSHQHDSYVNRYQNHSINCMAICTSQKLFTYVFVGYPGSAHDSRVFSNSSLVRHIEQYGKQKYFPRDEYALIGDSAFPLKPWLMKPYSRRNNLTRKERHHNFCLSSDRVCIENAFGILKGRWARLKFINTYSISKAIEITTAACILHNYCYMNDDQWEEEIEIDHDNEEEEYVDDREAYRLAKEKRDNIATFLFNNRI
ncbi:putative nuclease HARBI1 [Tribolium madens]|uniref:putative nuclease HARBI1 n=1 Tax=Tribolium madens TaxID=41895 RepID=UPI001CF723B2|nr:putative nuclease HARBI1 [Tribolium madens]